MRSESHISITKSSVREGEITRHAAKKLEGGRTFALATGLGQPRTWPLATLAVMTGFEKALEASRGGGKSLEGAGRALHCAEASRVALTDYCETLVERILPDSALGAMFVEHGDLHVVSAGPVRAYLHRDAKPQRLTPREEPQGGILRSAVTHCSVSVEPGDLVMMGSVSAFSMRAISQVMSVLSSDPKTAPSVLASVLTDPAGQAGVGAVAIVARFE